MFQRLSIVPICVTTHYRRNCETIFWPELAFHEVINFIVRARSLGEVSFGHRKVLALVANILIGQVWVHLAIWVWLLVDTKPRFIGSGQNIETVITIITTNDCMATVDLEFTQIVGRSLVLLKKLIQILTVVNLAAWQVVIVHLQGSKAVIT